MATSSGGGILRDLGHPGLNDTLKVHNSVTFKLVKTGKHCEKYFSFIKY